MKEGKMEGRREGGRYEKEELGGGKKIGRGGWMERGREEWRGRWMEKGREEREGGEGGGGKEE